MSSRVGQQSIEPEQLCCERSSDLTRASRVSNTVPGTLRSRSTGMLATWVAFTSSLLPDGLLSPAAGNLIHRAPRRLDGSSPARLLATRGMERRKEGQFASLLTACEYSQAAFYGCDTLPFTAMTQSGGTDSLPSSGDVGPRDEVAHGRDQADAAGADQAGVGQLVQNGLRAWDGPDTQPDRRAARLAVQTEATCTTPPGKARSVERREYGRLPWRYAVRASLTPAARPRSRSPSCSATACRPAVRHSCSSRPMSSPDASSVSPVTRQSRRLLGRWVKARSVSRRRNDPHQ